MYLLRYFAQREGLDKSELELGKGGLKAWMVTLDKIRPHQMA